MRTVPADPGDVDTLLPLLREFYAGERLPFDETRLRRSLEAMSADPRHGRVWLARDDGEPAGYGVLCFGFSLEHGGVDAFVDELYVRPECRGRGIGTALLAVMEAACREAGVTRLHLEVDDDNEAGRRLYLGRGFVSPDRRLMTKPLDEPPENPT
ncbi:MAG TPA: GNAT family N-acetyltransferase [Gemmatimonadota bacterium]|nr:GNAT family N-acetyltransferase [Gemmatimonadota bacterium]